MFGQAPGAGGPGGGGLGGEFVQQLELLGWVDRSALAVLLVFFVLGLFKGLFWQVSRIAILLVSYVVAGRFGGEVGHWLAGLGSTPPAGEAGAAQGAPAAGETTLYLAYLLVFLAVLILLSLIATQVQKLLRRSGLTFFDRLGGGLFGIATGACTVLFLLFVVNMFFRDTVLWREAEASHSQRLSRRAIEWLGPRVPDELRNALELAPLAATGRAAEPDGAGAEGARGEAVAPLPPHRSSPPTPPRRRRP